MLFKLSNLNSNLALTLGYLNPALNNSAKLFRFFKKIIFRLSVPGRRYLTPVSNVCEAALMSLFCVPNGLSELPEMRLKYSFNLSGRSTMAF